MQAAGVNWGRMIGIVIATWIVTSVIFAVFDSLIFALVALIVSLIALVWIVRGDRRKQREENRQG